MKNQFVLIPKQLSLLLIMLSLASTKMLAQISIEAIGTLPEAVSNNAVCEGFIDGQAYVFSFGGIDQSKNYDGIHLRSYRYNIEDGTSIQIPNLPDTLGKIAASASRIGDIIYIIGGYHVFENGTESSSDKIHRYDVVNNVFLTDGWPIPIATDDQVQAVYKDSLIYVISGWSDNGNIPNVQIYDPSLDAWTMGTPLPSNQEYFSFGSNGVIIDNIIYFYGGANGSSFDPQFRLRKGIIDSNDPTQIEWSITAIDFTKTRYRLAAAQSENHIYWIGGSANTYNFNGIAYDGSGGVSPTNSILYNSIDKIETELEEMILDEIPMDLRGIGNVSTSKKYLAGGMLQGQEVTDKVFELVLDPISSTSNLNQINDLIIYPNPAREFLHLVSDYDDRCFMQMLSSQGKTVKSKVIDLGEDSRIPIQNLESGIYFIQVLIEDQWMHKKVVVNNIF